MTTLAFTRNACCHHARIWNYVVCRIESKSYFRGCFDCHSMLRLLACVFIGSGIGGVLRYLVSIGFNRLVGISMKSPVGMFPWATFSVNILGCFLIGLVYGIVDNGSVNVPEEVRVALTTGLCGGLTTFSTFSHENYLLLESRDFGTLALYVSMSLILGLLAAWAGHAVVR